MNRLIFIFILNSVNIYSTNNLLIKKFNTITHFGINKVNYNRGLFKSNIFGESQTIFYNPRLNINLSQELIYNKNNNFNIGIGLNFSSNIFYLTYTNFNDPDIVTANFHQKIRHQYFSTPLNLYWRIPISSLSSINLYTGLEPFRTINFQTIGNSLKSVYLKNGSTNSESNVSYLLTNSNFSLLNLFNFGIKFNINELSKNRIILGLNYSFMKSDLELRSQSIVFLNNKNYKINNYINFDSYRISIGYRW